MKFRGLDRNHDGRITRDEWRGNDNSFSVHDGNGDGVLSGSEVGAALQTAGYDDFSELDRNRDARISPAEWGYNRPEFDRLDSNHDGVLTRQEYMGTAVQNHDTSFREDDRNRDGVISRTEWQGERGTFDRLDDNRDGVLSRDELLDASSPPTLRDRYATFRQLDRNSNSRISRDEWTGDGKSFDAMDDNRNGQLSRDEFLEPTRAERIAIFKRFDLNGNNVIGQNEWSGDKRSFARLDTDNDGQLTRDEFLKSYHGLDEHFRDLDRDHDGLVSRSEWRGERKVFDHLDDNHDGQLSFEDFLGAS